VARASLGARRTSAPASVGRTGLRLRRSLVLAVAFAVCAPAGAAGAAGAAPAKFPSAAASGRSKTLSPPKTSLAQDTAFFRDVAEVDPALATYEQKQGNVALRALLTDGAAFCALLRHSRGIDDALVAEAEGVRSTETKTSLPLSVTTFNTIESVSLLTLCPSELRLLPASDRSKVRRLGAALAQRSG